MSELFRNAHKTLNQYVAFTGWTVLVAQILAVVVFPLMEIAIRQQPTPVGGYVTVGVYTLHAIAGIYATYGLYKLREFTKLAGLDAIEQETINLRQDYSDLEATVEETEKQLVAVVHRSAAVQGALSVLQGLLQSPELTSPTPEHIKKLLAPLITKRSETLDYNSNDFHNFAVYLVDTDKRMLDMFFRECDDRIQRHNRSWPIGNGHVGIAFAQRKTIISGDISNIKDFIVSGGYRTDTDYYASFISTPIFDSLAGEPMGILVITSNRPSHFSDEYKLLIESFSLILSMFFSETNSRLRGAKP